MTKESANKVTKDLAIPASDEAWESGALGREEEFVGVIDEDIEKNINDSLDLKLVSIRLQKSLIEDFKMIAQHHGIGYQPLMRQILTRFAEGEKRQLLNRAMIELAKCMDSKEHSSTEDDGERPKKIA